MEEKKIIINSLLINYYSKIVKESKYNIIFIHGWRSEGRVWQEVINRLNYSCYAIDLPGFGESQLPAKPFTLDDYSEIIRELISKLHLENIVLVGHSNGGAVSIKSIVTNKFPVQKLVLVGSSGIRKKTFEKSTKNLTAKILKPIFKLPVLNKLRNLIYTSMGSEDYVAEPQLKETYINMISEDLSPEINKINVPTLLFWGEKDKATPLSYGEFMKENIPDSKLTVIPNGDHFAFLKHNEVFTTELQQFIS